MQSRNLRDVQRGDVPCGEGRVPGDPSVGIHRHLGVRPGGAHRGEAQRAVGREVAAARQPGARVDGHGLQGELPRCPRLRGVALQRGDVRGLGVVVVGEVFGQSRLVQPRLDGLVLPCPVAVHQCLPVDGAADGHVVQLGQLRNARHHAASIAIGSLCADKARGVEADG